MPSVKQQVRPCAGFRHGTRPPHVAERSPDMLGGQRESSGSSSSWARCTNKVMLAGAAVPGRGGDVGRLVRHTAREFTCGPVSCSSAHVVQDRGHRWLPGRPRTAAAAVRILGRGQRPHAVTAAGWCPAGLTALQLGRTPGILDPVPGTPGTARMDSGEGHGTPGGSASRARDTAVRAALPGRNRAARPSRCRHRRERGRYRHRGERVRRRGSRPGTLRTREDGGAVRRVRRRGHPPSRRPRQLPAGIRRGSAGIRRGHA